MKKLIAVTGVLIATVLSSVEQVVAQVSVEALRLEPCPEELYYAVPLEVPQGQAIVSLRWAATATPTRTWVVEAEGISSLNTPRLSEASNQSVTQIGEEYSTQLGTPISPRESPVYLVLEFPGRGDACQGGLLFERTSTERPGYVGAPGGWYKLATSLAPDITMELEPAEETTTTVVLGRSAGGSSLVAGEDDAPEAWSPAVSIQPNPFNPNTQIRFTQSVVGDVAVRIYSVRGTLVWEKKLVGLGKGQHSLDWGGVDSAGQSVASGVYLVRVRLPSVVLSRRAVLLK